MTCPRSRRQSPRSSPGPGDTRAGGVPGPCGPFGTSRCAGRHLVCFLQRRNSHRGPRRAIHHSHPGRLHAVQQQRGNLDQMQRPVRAIPDPVVPHRITTSPDRARSAVWPGASTNSSRPVAPKSTDHPVATAAPIARRADGPDHEDPRCRRLRPCRGTGRAGAAPASLTSGLNCHRRTTRDDEEITLCARCTSPAASSRPCRHPGTGTTARTSSVPAPEG
jgi:hypothetical protein